MQDLIAGVLFFLYACLELEFELVFSGYRHVYVVVQGFLIIGSAIAPSCHGREITPKTNTSQL